MSHDNCAMCAGMSEDQYDAQTMALIDQFGHAVQAVSADPAFSYTVGRSLVDKADLLLTGNLPFMTARNILNHAAALIDEGTLDPTPGTETDLLLRGFPMRIVAVSDLDAAEMFMAKRVARTHGKQATALQLVWPDSEGRFPGEPGCTLAQPTFA